MSDNGNVFVSCILVAAGSSLRMGGISKQLYLLENKPIIAHTINAFLECDYIKEIIIVCKADEQELMEEISNKTIKSVPYKIVAGGSTRQDSVFNGVRAASTKTDYFAIHDGARPLVSLTDIENCIKLAILKGAATLGVQVKDTIKVVSKDNLVLSTPDRDTLFAIQTPQIFKAKLYLKAMQKALKEAKSYTDDCQLMENIGEQVSVCVGSYENIKITTQEDIYIANAIMEYLKKGI